MRGADARAARPRAARSSGVKCKSFAGAAVASALSSAPARWTANSSCARSSTSLSISSLLVLLADPYDQQWCVADEDASSLTGEAIWRSRSLHARSPKAARFVPCGSGAEGLALDDVVDLEHLGLARELDANVGQYRHQTLAERVELLPRIPDLTDSEAPARTESDVVGKPVRRPLAPGILQPLDAFVVLLGRHARCSGEASEDASVRRGGGH